jgi:transcriptional regulator with XRE-family HTH domain
MTVKSPRRGPRKPTFVKPRYKPTFIRQWREFRGLTQDQLAERVGKSKAQLSRIENGLQPYSQDFLEACADALRTDPASLITRDPTDLNAIWVVWEKAAPADRERIEAVVNALAARSGTKV